MGKQSDLEKKIGELFTWKVKSKRADVERICRGSGLPAIRGAGFQCRFRLNRVFSLDSLASRRVANAPRLPHAIAVATRAYAL